MSPRPALLPWVLTATLLTGGGGTAALGQEVASATSSVTASGATPLPERPSNGGGSVVPEVAAVDPARALPVATASPSRHWVTSVEWAGRSYRWSAQRGAVDIGVGFDASDPTLRPLDLRGGDAAAPLVPMLPTISLGMRRARSVGASSLLGRALGTSGEGESVSRVGIEWKPAQPQVSFLREGLGVRLDGNDRMTVRLRKGMLGIYMHRKF